MTEDSNPTLRFDDEAHVERAEDLVAAEVESKTVVLHIGSGKFHLMNPVATRLWEQLEAPLTITELTKRLQTIFDVTAATCRADVEDFLQEMSELGMVRITPPS